jgi:hypothetical protein
LHPEKKMDAAERRAAASAFLKAEPSNADTTSTDDGEVLETELEQGDEPLSGEVDDAGDDTGDDGDDDEADGGDEGGEGDDAADDADDSADDADDSTDDDADGDGEGGEDDDEGEPDEITLKANIVTEIAEALDQTDYPIDFSDPEKGAEELAARLTDANAFYAIIDGRGTVDALFGRITQFQGKEVHDAVLVKVLEYAKAQGMIESADDGGDNGGFVDPVAQENARLKAELARARGQANPIEANARNRDKAIVDTSVSELAKLSKKDKLDDWTFNNVVIPNVARMISGNKAILNRIARGNFVDLHKFYDEVSARLVGRRVAKNNQRVAGRKNRDRNVPRVVAGERTTAAAEPKADLSTRDGRMKAAKAALRG